MLVQKRWMTGEPKASHTGGMEKEIYVGTKVVGKALIITVECGI